MHEAEPKKRREVLCGCGCEEDASHRRVRRHDDPQEVMHRWRRHVVVGDDHVGHAPADEVERLGDAVRDPHGRMRLERACERPGKVRLIVYEEDVESIWLSHVEFGSNLTPHDCIDQSDHAIVALRVSNVTSWNTMPDGATRGMVRFDALMRSVRKLLGARVKQLREEESFTVAQAAAALGIDASHLYGIERGDYAPSLETLVGLATLYKVDMTDMFVFPGTHLRHDLRELMRSIPNAKLADVKAAVEQALGTRLDTKRSAPAKGRKR